MKTIVFMAVVKSVFTRHFELLFCFVAQPSNQFQPISSSNSTSLCSSLFAMSPGPTKESDQSTSVGFALFGDQPTSKPGNHGIQPLSPGFTFNFGGSPKIPDDRSMGQGGGAFNLF